jgi:hypothetical protein
MRPVTPCKMIPKRAIFSSQQIFAAGAGILVRFSQAGN